MIYVIILSGAVCFCMDADASCGAGRYRKQQLRIKRRYKLGRIIAFDIGDKRIGVAITDPFNEMALPVETYWRKSLSKDIDYLVGLAKDKYCDKIVCGLPVNFDGKECEQTEKTKFFIEELRKKTDIEIITQDERFSTKEARRLLLEADMRREKRKDVIDKIAASYILEDYLRRLKSSEKN